MNCEQRARRRVRRQQLVRRVGEHDEPDRLVRVDDPAQRRRDARVDRAGDARRHVERDDAGARAFREHRGAAGAGRAGDDEEPARASPRARRRAAIRTSDVRCAAPCRRGRSASGTATLAMEGRRLLTSASSCAPRACSANSSTSSSSGVRCDHASSRAMQGQLVGALDAELAGHPLERLPLQRLVAVSRARSAGRRARARAACPGRSRARCASRPHDEVPAVREPEQPRARTRRRAPSASQKRRLGRVRYVGDATGVKSKRQLRRFVLREERCDAGAHLREHLDRRPARVDPVRRLAARR